MERTVMPGNCALMGATRPAFFQQLRLPALLAPQVVQVRTEGAAHRHNMKCLIKWLSI